MATATTQTNKREAFGSRNVFILSAIGSAVGLGNIWRFPYVAYEGGGGAFLIPYLCALLTAGIPLLFFDYAIGHRFRGSAPLAFRRMHRSAETLGWWQVLICVVISVYYAVIIAWSAMYTWFSAQLTWGKGNEQDFFFTDFLQMADVKKVGVSTEFVPQVGVPLLMVWLVVIVIMCLGVKRGIGAANMILMPLWLQTQLGYTATWAGLVSAPTGMVAVLLTPIAAGLMARTDARLVASIAFGAAAASYFLRAGLTNDASFIAIALPLMVQGIASASFFIAVVMIILDGMPQARIPDASGLANFVRIIASGFAASLVTTLWDNREALHQSRLADGANDFSPIFRGALANLHRLGLPDLSAKAALTRSMTGQAYLLAANDIFWASGWICIILIGMVWLCRRAISGGGPVAAD